MNKISIIVVDDHSVVRQGLVALLNTVPDMEVVADGINGLQVIELIVRGNSNKAIGARLDIAEATVKSHVNNILRKLGVVDRTQAVTTAFQRGLIHLP